MQNTCYHCGSINKNNSYSALVLQELRYFCCPGCQAVAEAIVQNGLENYYSFRSELAAKAADNDSDILQSLRLFDEKSISDEFVYQDKQGSEIQLSIAGINCAACGWLIEKQLSQLSGIKKVGANVMAKRLVVIWDNQQLKLSQILQKIQQIGYAAKPFQAEQHEALHQLENKTLLKRLGLAGLMTMQVMMLNLGVFFDLFGHIDSETKHYFSWVSLILSSPVAFYSAMGFYLSAFKALKAGSVNMDVPISFALICIYISGCYATLTHSGQTYFESLCMFVFLLLISRFLEQSARFKATQVSSNLLNHMPTMATLLINGEHQVVLAKTLLVGQQVLVKAGQVIPIDGKVVQGIVQVNESMLTGEFELATKHPQDKVYAGTINQVGTLVVEVSHELKFSLANQINQLQHAALMAKPKIAMLADRVAQYFVLFVLITAALTFTAWYFIDADKAFWVAISVLIATCPCALGLATPVSLTCVIANLNKQGVLLKRADVLEQLNNIDWVGLDKTGTLTEGHFALQELRNLSQLTNSEILKIAASLEQYSSHPIASVFKQHPELVEVEHAQELIAQGIVGNINGIEYRIGSNRLMNLDIPADLQEFSVYLANEDTLLAAFKLSDTLRKDAEELITYCKPRHIALLSGDTPLAVKSLADSLHIPHWHAQLDPQQKLDIIIQAQNAGHKVLMVGDGINDAPVLAQADVSITLDMSTDLAKSSADVILLENNLHKIPILFALARKTQRNIKQNMSWAIGYNMLILPLAVFGVLSPLTAVIGMSLSSLLVVLNASRLLRN
ncbi:heavy metal translocating P-type ATPase [Paraglaciecola sp.]|uniref:heavy metal translocating P-type ATPase n=1 Tax=Paraglaciecola sp. TaxID=1920173 RepID=UPI0030F4110D